MVVIRGELARAGLERKRVDQLYSARRERRERPGKKYARNTLPAPLRCDHEADDDCGLESDEHVFGAGQGDEVGRPSRLGLRVDGEGRIFVSGQVIELGRGVIAL